jgi:hypothetical protein
MNSSRLRFSFLLVLMLSIGSIAHAECQKTPAEIAQHAGALLRQTPKISTITPDEREAIACLADAVETLAKQREEATRAHDQSSNSGRATPHDSATSAASQ